MEPKMTPKDFFLHLTVMVVLYAGVFALLRLLFTVIDYRFANPLTGSPYSPFGSPISWPIAALIVLFPLYLGLNWLLERDYARLPEKRELKIRKWLIYLTLFMAAAAIVGDLITVIYYFLDGQILTTSFLLKVLAILTVAGIIFTYYLLDLRSRLSAAGRRGFAAGTLFLILLAMVAGFLVMGSPYTQRARRADAIRIQNLNEIQWQIVNYWQAHGVLPENLAALADPISGFNPPIDPKSGQVYEYTVTAPSSFRLCATFDLASENDGPLDFDRSKPLPAGDLDGHWRHSAGKVCFDRSIDPVRYPRLPR